jgi:hypothetical protein
VTFFFFGAMMVSLVPSWLLLLMVVTRCARLRRACDHH